MRRNLRGERNHTLLLIVSVLYWHLSLLTLQSMWKTILIMRFCNWPASWGKVWFWVFCRRKILVNVLSLLSSPWLQDTLWASSQWGHDCTTASVASAGVKGARRFPDNPASVHCAPAYCVLGQKSLLHHWCCCFGAQGGAPAGGWYVSSCANSSFPDAEQLPVPPLRTQELSGTSVHLSSSGPLQYCSTLIPL